MKIIVSQPRLSYYVGGGEKTPAKHIEYLTKLGVDVTLVTLKPPKRVQYSPIFNNLIKTTPTLKVIEITIPSKYESLYEEAPGINRDRWEKECIFFGNLFVCTLQKLNFDLVSYYYLTDSIFKTSNGRSVCHLFGYPQKYDQIMKTFLNMNDLLISISKQVYKKWSRLVYKSTSHIIINSGVDLDYDSGEYYQLSNKYKILFAGRLIPRKGVNYLLNSINSLIKQGLDIGLWIAGEGPQQGEIEEYIIKEDLTKNVVLLGQINNLGDYYKNTDLCIFPSIEKEGLMNVVLEAMSFGCAIITTKHLGSEDIISNYKNGILISAKNSEELAQVIKNVLLDDHLKYKIGNNAKVFAENNLTWNSVAERLYYHYNKLLK